MQMKSLNEKLSFAEELRSDLKNIQKELVVSKLEKRIDGLDDKFSKFSKQIVKYLESISKNLEKT